MWPWGHLAVGYLSFVAITHWWRGDRRSVPSLLAVGIGTQLPDLVDKPLAWTFSLLPSGRSLAHSLFVAAACVALVARLANATHREEITVPVGVGYLSHLLSDVGPGVLVGLLQGDLSQLQWATYLLWPLLAVPPYPNDESFLTHLQAFRLDPYVTFQFALFGVAVAVWIADGAPGLSAVRRACARNA